MMEESENRLEQEPNEHDDANNKVEPDIGPRDLVV
jgi:hypothetical protein